MVENDNKEKQAGDYLNKFLSKNENEEIQQVQKIENPIPSTLNYLNVDLDQMPLGMFYQLGTQIKIRAAKVAEIQSYAIVDDRNVVDVTEKMNQILSSCVKVILPGGKIGSYKDVRDGDRIYLIFMIRELTFQKGNSLAKEVKCEFCSNEFKIPFRATSNTQQQKTFEYFQMPDQLAKFYDSELRCFLFDINGVKYKLAPPTIGIQETFFADFKAKFQAEKNPDVGVLKVIPYLLYDRTTITPDGIKEKEDEFKRLDMETFQILNSAVGLMQFGIKGLKAKCQMCSGEVCTNMVFPEGASGIFVIRSYFDDFIKK